MKEVFYVAVIIGGLTDSDNMEIALLPQKYATYPEAQAAIATLPVGTYQVQKFFEVG